MKNETVIRRTKRYSISLYQWAIICDLKARTMMQIVIEIPEEQYDLILKSHIIANSAFVSKECMMYAIKNGTPLPEHHGRLGDLDKLSKRIIRVDEDTIDRVGYGGCVWSTDDILEEIERTPTIIPATKEGESE